MVAERCSEKEVEGYVSGEIPSGREAGGSADGLLEIRVEVGSVWLTGRLEKRVQSVRAVENVMVV